MDAIAVSRTASNLRGSGGGRGSRSGYRRLNRFKIGTNSFWSWADVLLADGCAGEGDRVIIGETQCKCIPVVEQGACSELC